MAFETFKSSVRVADAPTGAARAANNAGQQALNTLNKFTNVATNLAGAMKSNQEAKKGLELIKQETSQTEQGAKQVSEGDFTLKEGQDTFNSIVTKGHNLAQQNTLRVELAKLRTQYIDDPEAYQSAAQGLISGTVEGSLDSESAAEIKIFGENLLTNDVITLNQKEAELAQSKAKAEIAVNVDNAVTDSLNYAYNGDLNAMGDSVEALIHNIDDGVESGSITPVKAAEMKLAIGDQVTQATLSGNFDRALEISVDGGEEFINQVKSSEIAGLNPKQKKALVDEFQSDLNAKKRELLAEQKEIIKANKEQIKFEGQVANVTTHIDSGVPLDYKNKEDKESVNAIYDRQFTGSPLGDPLVEAQQVNFVKSTGVVPEAMKSGLRSALYSNNPEVIKAAAEQFNKLEKAYPQSIEQFSKQDIAYAQRISSLVNSGVPVDEAVEVHQLFLKKPLAERGKEILQQYSSSDLREMSSKAVNDFASEKYGGLFTSSPEVPTGMSIEYNRLFKEGVGLTGDVEQASQWALKNLNNVWGVSELNGNKEMMKYPPEKVLAGVDGEVDWISKDWKATQDELTELQTGFSSKDLTKEKAQLNTEIQNATLSSSTGHSVNVDEQRARLAEIETLETTQEQFTFELVADDETRRATPPTWVVMQVDESGLSSPAINEDGTVFRWSVSYNETAAYKEEQRLKKQKVERAKELQAIRDDINANPQRELEKLQINERFSNKF